MLVTPLVSIMKDQVEELTYLGLRAFAIDLGDKKGEKELVAGGFDMDLLYGSPETLLSKQWSRSARKANCLFRQKQHQTINCQLDYRLSER